jgi:hypothetical protein
LNDLKDLQEKIKKLDIESQNVAKLDDKINLRIIENKRIISSKETKLLLSILDLNASKRIPIPYLFIHAEKTSPITLLNSLQFVKFHLITSQEIRQKIHNDRKGIFSIWNQINRLTEYNEFKQRANLLIENLEAGKLDDHLNTTSGELLYEILGETGKLLKHIGVDPSKNLTQIYLTKQIQQLKKLYEIFNSDPKKS